MSSKALITFVLSCSLLGCDGEPSAPAVSEDTSSDASLDAVGDSAIGAGTDASGDSGGRDSGSPGSNQVLVAHDAAHVFWSGWDEGQNARAVDVSVNFPPAEELYAGMTMHFALSCPNGRCDPWDRYGSFGLVRFPGAEDEGYVELSRFITPYGVGANWDVDVTDLRPLLTGEVTLRVFIDTWVGPGSSFGDGWQVDVSFDLIGGVPEPFALEVVPVWDLTRVVYGDPARPVADQLPAETVSIAEGASRLALRTFITGHGQGNSDNCAEFCPREHSFTVGGVAHSRTVWRDDCETTAARGQQGTWQYPRAGWCPGAVTHDWTIDLGASESSELEIAYSVAPYENTCRPDAPECLGCTLGNGCEWNDSNHTEPNYQMSALLIAFR